MIDVPFKGYMVAGERDRERGEYLCRYVDYLNEKCKPINKCIW